MAVKYMWSRLEARRWGSGFSAENARISVTVMGNSDLISAYIDDLYRMNNLIIK